MTDAVTPVKELLQQLADSLDALAVSQQQELNAIVEREHSRVAELTNLKEQHLVAVSDLDRQLQEHPDNHLLRDDSELAEQVAATQKLLAEVRQQNEINERVVQSTLNSIEQLKQGILTNAKKDSLTYNAKGKMR